MQIVACYVKVNILSVLFSKIKTNNLRLKILDIK